jgi:UDP-N-acetylglucosamine--N-acetylmuramyl-(pentapeptide) pyrophosphoryl-undecaprenol N-acetylglucosamine transferase
MKILLAGGGTGGHILPLVAIIREMRRIYNKNDLEFFYIGQKDEFGLILLQEEGVEIKTIFAGKIRRYFSLQNIIDIAFKIPLGIIQSFFLLIKISPNIVVSKGGSGSFAITYSAKLLKIPVIIHESDIVPGLSNQFASHWAKKVLVSFPKTEFFDLSKVILAGNPIRKEILEGDIQQAKEIFNLTLEKPIILILGGSQGSQTINDFILLILNNLLQNFEIIHISGQKNFNGIKSESEVVINKDFEKYYHVAGFLNEQQLKHAYACANLIISRSGSGSIFEIAALGKPSILVPLPSAAADHQSKNAYAYANTGASLVIEEANLIPNFFMEKINYLFTGTERLQEMSDCALRFSKPLAARAVAREVLEYIIP